MMFVCDACIFGLWRARAPEWIPDVAVWAAAHVYNNAWVYGVAAGVLTGATALIWRVRHQR